MSLLKKLTGTDYDTLHIVGGGSKNVMLDSFTASACDVRVLAGPDEATAAGNILTQAITRGEIASLANAREVVGNSFDLIEYLPQNPKIWDRAYEKYRILRERI
jgi:sugar (pentulose or hexulose) kinase